MLAYCQEGDYKFGFCYFDFSTLKFYLGSFEDDITLKQFRTLGLQIRPVEVITASSSMVKGKPTEAMMILKNSHMPPSFSFISMNDINSEAKVKAKIAKYFGIDERKWPESLQGISNKDDDLAMTSLALAFTYLEQMLQAEVTIPVAEYYTQDEHSAELMKQGSMVIDA